MRMQARWIMHGLLLSDCVNFIFYGRERKNGWFNVLLVFMMRD